MNDERRGEGRAPRTPLIRARRLTMGELDAAARDALLDEIFPIFGHYFTGHDPASFASIALPTADTRVALLCAPGGAVAGFASSTITRLDIDGRPHAAIGASVFVRPEYRGGSLAAFFETSELLRFVLRNPGVPIGYLGAVLGPTTYQRFARSFERVYPNRRDGFPPAVARVARAFAEARGLRTEGTAPWVVDLKVRPLRTAPIGGARAQDPDVRYFCEQNPGYTAGQALLMWVPFDPANVGQMLVRLSRDAGGEAIGWLRARARGSVPRNPR